MIRDSLNLRSGAAFAAAAALGLSLALTAPAVAQDAEPDAPQAEESKKEKKKSKRQIKGEKRLAKMLEGRVAGDPQSCIRTFPTGQMRTIDGAAYVFGRGNTIYVQRTTNPRQIDDRETLITRRFGNPTQLCRQDLATTVDPVTQIFTGAVLFDDFVPYTLDKSNENG